MKLLLLYRRRWWLFYLPVLLCTVLALWWSATQWKVLPPAEVVIGAGSPQGGYSMLAQRYAEQLERMGVRAEIVYSDTQKGSLERLTRAGTPPASALPTASMRMPAQGAGAGRRRPGAGVDFLHDGRAVVAGASQRLAHRRRAGLVIVLHRGQADAGARRRAARRRSV
jgi:hypothetical protein